MGVSVWENIHNCVYSLNVRENPSVTVERSNTSAALSDTSHGLVFPLLSTCREYLDIIDLRGVVVLTLTMKQMS